MECALLPAMELAIAARFAVPADEDLSPILSERVVLGALAHEVRCPFLWLDDCDVPVDRHLELALDRRVEGVEISLGRACP